MVITDTNNVLDWEYLEQEYVVYFIGSLDMMQLDSCRLFLY